jgi:hypothetical protein
MDSSESIPVYSMICVSGGNPPADDGLMGDGPLCETWCNGLLNNYVNRGSCMTCAPCFVYPSGARDTEARDRIEPIHPIVNGL